jgi:hypothetical protein
LSIKRNKKPITAIRQSATHPTKTVTLVKAAPQPVLVATPVLAPQAHGHRKHSAVHQDVLSTTTIAKGLPQPSPVTAPVLSPKAARRDAHGRFLAKQSM